MRIVARCEPCGCLIVRRELCEDCAAAERAIASAEASESRIRAVLYPPGEFVEVLRRPRQAARTVRDVGRPRQSAQPARDRAGARRRVIAGRYEVLERLGAGGTATVYLARDLTGGEEVAIKVLHHMLSEDELAAERFRREARRAKRLRHPNIVRTFDHGACDGTHFITMEHLPGRSLKSLIASGPAPRPGDAVEIILQVLEATGFIHEHGIIHRDLSSRNVIADPHGRVKVMDFGISCTRATSVTPAGSLIGTIEYIAPERLKGESAGEASDLYSIGVMLYELLTGLLPFDGELVSTVALKHLHECPEPPSRLNAAVSPRLDAIVMRALEKAPEDRFPSAAAFAAALRREAAAPARASKLAAAA